MSINREVTQEEAQEILSEIRHQDLTKSLQDVVNAISNKDDGIKEALDNQEKVIKQFATLIKLLVSQEEKEIIVENNQDAVIQSISQMGQVILEGLNQVKQSLVVLDKPSEWDFKVDRNSFGYIQSIKAKRK